MGTSILQQQLHTPIIEQNDPHQAAWARIITKAIIGTTTQ